VDQVNLVPVDEKPDHGNAQPDESSGPQPRAIIVHLHVLTLSLRKIITNRAKFYGPFMLYHSNDWDQYLDNDYIVVQGAGNVSGLATR
jgi:hypothetical protein